MNKKIENLTRLASNISKWLDLNYANSDIPGLSVSVRYKSKPILDYVAGVANLETGERLSKNHVFRYASHSKMVATVAVMQLVEKGLIELDKPISVYLDWFTSEGDDRIEKITVREILTHSSGIIRDGQDANYWNNTRDFLSQEEIKSYIKTSKLVYESGSTIKYSNVAFSYILNLVEAVSGKKYSDYVKKEIFEPVGVSSTFCDSQYLIDSTKLADGHTPNYFQNGRQVIPNMNMTTNGMMSATGLISNPSDICKFLSKLSYGEEQIISDKSKKIMFKTSREIPGGNESYGLGFEKTQLDGLTWVGHGAGFIGHRGKSWLQPNEDIAVSVVLNGWEKDANIICSKIAEIISVYINFKWSSTSDKASLEKYEGIFFCGFGAIQIIETGEKLFAFKPDGWAGIKQADELSFVDESTLLIESASGLGSPGEQVKYSFNQEEKVLQISYAGVTLLPWDTYLKTQKV